MEQLNRQTYPTLSTWTAPSLENLRGLYEIVSKSRKFILQAQIFLKFSNSTISTEFASILQDVLDKINGYHNKLQKSLMPHLLASKELFISPLNYNSLKSEFCILLENAISSIKNMSSPSHQSKELVDEFLGLLDRLESENGTLRNSNTLLVHTDELIDAILLHFQSIMPFVEASKVDEDLDNYGMKEKDFTNALKIAGTYADTANLSKILNIIEKSINDGTEGELSDVAPFIYYVCETSNINMSDLILFTLKISKLAYIGASIFDTILKEGFCVPEGEAPSAGDGEDKEASGVGLGDGTGEQDISKEIENEGEVEELKSDENNMQNPSEQKDKNDDVIEANEDFDGQLEDVEDNEEDENQDGEEGENDMDEQMGDLEDSADVVDEKLWDEEDQEGKDEKLEKDAPVNGSPDEELVAQMEEQSLKEENDVDSKSKDMNETEDFNNSEDEENLQDKEMEENQGLDVRPDEFAEMEDSKDSDDMGNISDLEMDEDDGDSNAENGSNQDVHDDEDELNQNEAERGDENIQGI
jgi:midasin